MPQQPDWKDQPPPFIELQSVDSTNNYARGLIGSSRLPDGQEDLRDGMVIFAHEQTRGKGQMGKNWLAEKEANLIMSLLLRPAQLPVSKQFQLIASVAVAVQEFFAQYAGEDTRIKWPNDLYWQDRKAGGILIESVLGAGAGKEPGWNWAIIGIGININQVRFDPELKNPVSLKQITGKNYDPVELAKQLQASILQSFQQLLEKGFDQVYARYLSALYKKDQPVKLKKENRVFEAVIRSVSPDGKLVVQHALEERFSFGEVEWVLP